MMGKSLRLDNAMIKKVITVLLITIPLLLSSCQKSSTYEAQGYVEGRYTYMATSVSGNLEQLLVARGAQVKQGDLLFTLEMKPEIDEYNAAIERLQQTKAERDAIAANLEYAKITLDRNTALVRSKAIQQADLDNARAIFQATTANLAKANASIDESEASLAQIKWRLEQKSVRAPVDAVVFDTYYRLGELTEQNKAILSLLAPSDIKVIFYVDQPILDRIQLREKVMVGCDKCAKNFIGHISFISPVAEYTPPLIYSKDTNEKLTFRIEAEFSKEDAVQLHPGQPVRVIIHE